MTFDPKTLAAAGATAEPTTKPRKSKASDNANTNQPASSAPPDQGTIAAATQSPPVAGRKPAVERPADKATPINCMIEFPMGCVHDGFAVQGINVRLTDRQAAAAKMLWCSLARNGERFQGGRSSHPEGTAVDGVNDGVRWLFDRIADAIEHETGKQLTRDFGILLR